jgi:hypothetical protein
MPTRRTYLAGLGAASLAGLAGCAGVVGTAADGGESADAPAGTPTPGMVTTGSPPVADAPLTLGHTTTHLRGQIMEGGPDKDGIPSIDDPAFVAPDAVDLADGDPVFGLALGDDVRAYPQSILVWHEIVNDLVSGVPVSVTYCPLTGTAMGFLRGDTTFGVSGRLVNNNLVMYDRAGDGRWQQVAATAIDGPREGESLREVRLVWTTWGAWRERHPDTRVLSTDTGYARDYARDPYGEYNPTRGYYDRENVATIFPTLVEDDRLPPKAVVMGARTPEGAVAFEKSLLRNEKVLTADLAGEAVVAVYDLDLDTAHVYRTGGATVEWVDTGGRGGDGEVRVDGTAHPAADLPLDPVYTFDAMWFAWVGFYPETGLVRRPA